MSQVAQSRRRKLAAWWEGGWWVLGPLYGLALLVLGPVAWLVGLVQLVRWTLRAVL